MYCPNCGCENNDDATICSNCGTELQQEPISDEKPMTEPDSETNKKPIIIIGCLLVMIVAVVVTAILIMHSKNYTENRSPVNSTLTTVENSVIYEIEEKDNSNNSSTELSVTNSEIEKITGNTTNISTTQRKGTTTKKPTTTQKRETTTSAKVTTTQTTTVTTTEARCTNNGNHSRECGNIGRWYSSEQECKDALRAESLKHYEETSVAGATVMWSCSYCGKYTGDLSWLQ